jgi:ubiquinone/menaquinone biosynthesis C-methylase UbiE
MKRAELFHPRVFSDQEWAEGYYKRNVKNIERVGKRFVKILRKSGVSEGRVLDTGCGFGSVAIELAKSFPDLEIVGVDLGDPLLELGRSLAEKAGVAGRVTFAGGDVQALEFPDNDFDIVINTFMAHIVDEPVEMFNEIERVARPGAPVLVTDLRRTWLGILAKKLRTAFTLDEAKALIEESSLRPGQFSTGPYWWDYMMGFQEPGQ